MRARVSWTLRGSSSWNRFEVRSEIMPASTIRPMVMAARMPRISMKVSKNLRSCSALTVELRTAVLTGSRSITCRSGRGAPRDPGPGATARAPTGQMDAQGLRGYDSAPFAGSRHAPVAQLDRVSPSEGEGHWFESSRARHSSRVHPGCNSHTPSIRLHAAAGLAWDPRRRASSAEFDGQENPRVAALHQQGDMGLRPGHHRSELLGRPQRKCRWRQ